MSEAPFKSWHKSGYFEVIYPKFLEVLERVKVAQVVSIQSFRGEPDVTTARADSESSDEWE